MLTFSIFKYTCFSNGRCQSKYHREVAEDIFFIENMQTFIKSRRFDIVSWILGSDLCKIQVIRLFLFICQP